MSDDLAKVLDKLEEIHDEITNIQQALRNDTNRNLESIINSQRNLLQKLGENPKYSWDKI